MKLQPAAPRKVVAFLAPCGKDERVFAWASVLV
jgi:hypothetical protein